MVSMGPLFPANLGIENVSGGVLVFEFFALMVIDAGVSFSFYKNNLFHITIE